MLQGKNSQEYIVIEAKDKQHFYSPTSHMQTDAKLHVHSKSGEQLLSVENF